MSVALAAGVAGWVLAAALGVLALRLRRRLELVACAEHELRGPMAALLLNVETLGRRERAGDGVAAAALLTHHLERMRAGFADLTAARHGRRAPSSPQPLRLDAVMRDAARAWRPMARRSGGGVTVDWRAGDVAISADRGRLDQAMGNLLSNAVQHGGGRIDVRAHRAGAGVRLEVSDAGPGLRNGPGPAAEGAGRGLGIAARAVADSGGTLTALPGPHGGTTVAVELPLDAA